MERAKERRIAIVTGAGGGIGGATARRFARDGYHVVASDIHTAAGEALAHEIGGTFFKADVTREDDVAALVAAAIDSHGRLDAMINNAGVIGAVGPITKMNAAHWAETIAILLDSVFFGVKHAADAMIKSGRGGAILSTTSAGGLAAFAPHAYSAAKAAVIGLTWSTAAELAQHEIRVNAVAPGYVVTPMTVSGSGGSEAELRANAALRNPMPHVVETEEIAAAFAYLASDDARSVTGRVLPVDAGLLTARLPTSFYAVPSGFVGNSHLPVG